MQFKIWRGEGGKQLRQKVYYGRCTNRGNFPPPGSIILTRLLSSRSLILATCDNFITLFEALSATDRSGLMDDAFHLAR